MVKLYRLKVTYYTNLCHKLSESSADTKNQKSIKIP